MHHQFDMLEISNTCNQNYCTGVRDKSDANSSKTDKHLLSIVKTSQT